MTDAAFTPDGAARTHAGPDAGQLWAERQNLALLTDFYELTMLDSYWRTGRHQTLASFEYFFREFHDHTGFLVTAGLEQLLDLIENFRFDEQDLAYLDSLNSFTDGFLEYLRDFRPQGKIWSLPEGSIAFPHEPLLRVEAPLAEAQLLETAILNSLNYPSLIATKASRICLAANGDPVMEFGLRRAQGPDGGLSGSRAAYIGGASSTSNVLAGKLFGIPVTGTHAHSWVMSFEDELDAFRTYCRLHPKGCLLLVDTYDTLTSGLPHALEIFKEMRDAGMDVRPAIRLDSGDLSRLSKAAYRMFTQAGFHDPTIAASNELDEDLIADLKRQGAKINLWGVGTHLITSSNWPALGGVYKLTAMQKDDGSWEPRIKLSSNPAKMTDPGRKRVVRYYNEQAQPIADILYEAEGELPETGPLVPYVGRVDLSFTVALQGAASCEEILVPVMEAGKRVAPSPPLVEVRDRAQKQIAALPEELRRLRNPEIYTVGLSPTLARRKADLMSRAPGVIARGS